MPRKTCILEQDLPACVDGVGLVRWRINTMLEGAEVSLMINGGAAKHLAFGQKTMVVVAFLSATLQSLCKERKRRGKEKGKEEEKGEKRRKKRRRERVIMMLEP